MTTEVSNREICFIKAVQCYYRENTGIFLTKYCVAWSKLPPPPQYLLGWKQETKKESKVTDRKSL